MILGFTEWFQLLGSRAQAQYLWRMGFIALRMWDLLGPGMDPVSPALAGGSFTTEPPGQLPIVCFCLHFYCLRKLT